MQGTEAEFLQTIELLLSKDNRRHKSQMDNSFLSESFYWKQRENQLWAADGGSVGKEWGKYMRNLC